MRCKCKVLSVNGVPASDGSIIPFEVMNDYINSQKCQEDLKLHRMIGSLTHRSRSIAANLPDQAALLSKTIGKDDSLIIVSDKTPSPTHYIDKLYIEDGWLWCEIELLKEDGLDDIAVQNIRRLSGMLKNGIHPGVSAVIVGYWDGQGNGSDVLKKLVKLKGIDVTLCPSWVDASVTEIFGEEDKNFSEISSNINPKDFEFSGIKVKAFSNLDELDINSPKTSKIDNKFTRLAGKVFSSNGVVEAINLDESVVVEEEKTFSAATVNERVRFAKLSPRERFRRMILDYRQSLKSQGGIQKINPETLKVMKSLFATDVLDIMKTVTPLVLQGKNLMTLLNAGSLGVQVRKACQNMYIPYRQALMEVGKQGFVSKNRYSKITAAYAEFIRALQDYVFGAEPLEIEEDNTTSEENKK